MRKRFWCLPYIWWAAQRSSPAVSEGNEIWAVGLLTVLSCDLRVTIVSDKAPLLIASVVLIWNHQASNL